MAEKNLVYQNPFDFKEKKQFKSKWEEYRKGDWRRGTGKTYVTLETVIPELPEKEITAPDEAAFHKKQIEIENKIKDLIKNSAELRDKFQGLIDEKVNKRATGRNKDEPESHGDKVQHLKSVIGKKKRIHEKLADLEENKGDLIKRRENLMKKINPKWNTSELVPKGLKELKKKLETSSTDHKQEAFFI